MRRPRSVRSENWCDVTTIRWSSPEKYHRVVASLTAHQRLVFALRFLGFDVLPEQELGMLLPKRPPGQPPPGFCWRYRVTRKPDPDWPHQPPIGRLFPSEIGRILGVGDVAVRKTLLRIRDAFGLAGLPRPVARIDRRGCRKLWNVPGERVLPASYLDWVFDQFHVRPELVIEPLRKRGRPRKEAPSFREVFAGSVGKVRPTISLPSYRPAPQEVNHYSLSPRRKTPKRGTRTSTCEGERW